MRMFNQAKTKKGLTITLEKEYNNYNQYYIYLGTHDIIARYMTYEAAARLFNSYVSDEDAIPLW